jgi:hypothetical protein
VLENTNEIILKINEPILKVYSTNFILLAKSTGKNCRAKIQFEGF